jgi:multidrug resistance efflux pump
MSLYRRRRIGAAVWVVGMVVVGTWAVFRRSSVEAIGVGFSPPVQVAPIEPGRLMTLNVSLHSPVKAGDIVASIDPTLVVAERDVASAVLLATRDRLGIELATESRRFAESAEGSMLTRAQLLSSIREDEATIRTLQERLSIEEKLVARGATAGLTADDVNWQLEVVQARLAASSKALAIANSAANNAESRNSDAPGMNQWEAVAAVRALDLVERRLEQYQLPAGIDGHVTQIYVSPGTMVSEGLPILEVRSLSTREVVAYVRPSEVERLVPGEDAAVYRASGERLVGTLLSVGGSPSMYPLSLWPYPNEPQYGVPVRIELRNDGWVAPDEPVTVRM